MLICKSNLSPLKAELQTRDDPEIKRIKTATTKAILQRTLKLFYLETLAYFIIILSWTTVTLLNAAK